MRYTTTDITRLPRFMHREIVVACLHCNSSQLACLHIARFVHRDKGHKALCPLSR